jgi:hypothetical protein
MFIKYSSQHNWTPFHGASQVMGDTMSARLIVFNSRYPLQNMIGRASGQPRWKISVAFFAGCCCRIGCGPRTGFSPMAARGLGYAIYASFIRLVPVVTRLYLTLIHATSAFSLPLVHQRSSIQATAHHISFLSPSQHHHSRLNHFRIYFWDNKIEKTIV